MKPTQMMMTTGDGHFKVNGVCWQSVLTGFCGHYLS